MKYCYLFFSLLLLLPFSCNENQRNETMIESPKSKIVIGTYTKKEGHVDGKAEGIYIAEMSDNGSIEVIDTITGIVNPSYTIVHPNGQIIYSVSELAGPQPMGKVYAYEYRSENKATEKLFEISSFGNAPCHISINESTMSLYVANYMGGIINYKLHENGSLSADPQIIRNTGGILGSARQEAPHPHMAHGNNKNVFVTDLGTDEIIKYTIDENGILQEQSRLKTTAGAGPRHFAIDKNNERVYVIGELNLSIEVFNINGKNDMSHVQTISLNKGLNDESGQTASAIKIHPSGKYLYGAQRANDESKDNTIEQFAIDTNTGKLTHIGSIYTNGSVPRDFEISPNGKFLLVANQNSDNIATFSIDLATGLLSDTGFKVNVVTPASIKFFPS